MEKAIVIKDTTYGGGVTALADTVDNLADGEIGIYGAQNGTLLVGTGGDADYLDVKDVIIAYNKAGTVLQSKPINRRNILNVNYTNYLAPVNHTVVAGGTTASVALTVTDSDVGDVIVAVADKTFSSMYATNSNIASVYKPATMTAEAAVDALVAKLNANTDVPVTATKIGTDPNFGITIQSSTRGQILTLTLDGLLAGGNRVVDGSGSSVLPVNGNGVSDDVLAHEKEAATYLGDGNSRLLEDSFYSSAHATVDGATYDAMNFQEDLPNYVGATNVKPSFTIYVPTGATTLIAELKAVMAKVTQGTFVAATADEPGNA